MSQSDLVTNSVPVGDFFSPFYRVAFQAGNVVNANVNTFIGDDMAQTDATGVVVDNANDQSSLVLTAQNMNKYAASLMIESRCQGLRQFTLTMTPPYEDARRILDNALIRQGSLVKVQWGWTTAGGTNNILSAWHTFFNEQPKVNYADKDITITLTGFDSMTSVFGRLANRRTWKISDGYTTDAKILDELLRMGNFTSNLDTIALLVDLAAAVTLPTIFRTRTEDRVQQTDNLRFIREICNGNAMWFEVFGKNIVFRNLDVVMTYRSKYNFCFNKPPKTQYDVPVQSFTTNANAKAFLPPDAIETRVNTSNPRKKTHSTVHTTGATDATQKKVGPTSSKKTSRSGGGFGIFSTYGTANGAAAGAVGAVTTTLTGSNYSYPFNYPNASDVIASRRREADFWANDTATVTAPGIPSLMGSTIVNVDKNGVGIFGGPYLIADVSHTLSTDGYMMRLNLRRTVAGDVPGTVAIPQPNQNQSNIGGNNPTTRGPDNTTGSGVPPTPGAPN
jgi:hypothetical protein